MNIKFILLSLVTVLLGCAVEDEPQVQPPQNNTRPVVTVLFATVDEEDITDITMLCIDGVKYVVIPGIGVAVKYYNDGTNDPYPETCINHTPKN